MHKQVSLLLTPFIKPQTGEAAFSQEVTAAVIFSLQTAQRDLLSGTLSLKQQTRETAGSVFRCLNITAVCIMNPAFL